MTHTDPNTSSVAADTSAQHLTDHPKRTRRGPSRRLVGVAAAATLIAGVTGGAAYASSGKTATVMVDGQPRPVEFRGGTVDDVLAAAGLDVGAHDTLVPAASSAVQDGAEVALRRGREMTLVVDGKPRTVWTTAVSVDEALDQVGMREQGLALSASRSRAIPLDGLTLDVRTPKTFTITLDGKTRTVTTTAPTVRAALVEAGVVLDADDRLSHPRLSAPVEGMSFHAVRVRTERTKESVAIPFATQQRKDGGLYAGTTKLVQAGKAGSTERVVERVLTDGRVAKTTVVSSTQKAAPVTKVVAVGTKTRPAPAPAAAPARAAAPTRSSGSRSSAKVKVGSSGGLNWGALAACESGGNPGAVSSTGKYRGLYQFSTETWRGVGGSGDPAKASAAEQTKRAQALHARSGRGQWPVCGKGL